MRFWLFFLVFFIASCASSAFYNYSNNLKKDLVAGSEANTNKGIVKSAEDIEQNKLNSLLYHQESGLYSFLKQDYKTSIKYFKKAQQRYSYIDRQGKLELNKIANNTFSYTLLNDNSIPYAGSDYERALTHYYKALSFVAIGDLKSALIEFRATSNVQKFASHARRKKIDKAHRDIQKYNFNNQLAKTKSLDSELKISDLKSNFLNANSYYISGHIRELKGDSNSALVDYKKALEIEPLNSYYVKDAYRLALRYDIDYAKYIEKNYKVPVSKLQEYAQNYQASNTVLVIQEQGFIPVKKQFNLSFFVDSTLINIPLPYYDKNFRASHATLSLVKDRTISQVENFELASDVFRLEYNNLAEQYALILARAISRQIVSSTAYNKVARNKDGSINAVALLASVANEAVEFADLRSWRNLPAKTLVAKINVNDGQDVYVKTNPHKPILLKNEDIVANNVPSLSIVYVYSVYGANSLQKHEKDIYNIIYKGKK